MAKLARKLVLFDFDGTLVDSEKLFGDGLVEFSALRSLPCDRQKMAVGYVDPLKYDLGWGVALNEQRALLSDFFAYLEGELLLRRRFMPSLFSGAAAVLDDIRDEFDLGIVTARDRPTTMAIMEHLGITDLFPHRRTHCCTRERGYGLKPAPDALLCLLKDTGHDLDDVIMVGDTTSDILMANRAGVKNIAVLWGMHPAEKLATAQPTIMVDRISDLPQILRQMWQ